MKHYILGPRSGKTVRMLAISEFNGAPIICSDEIRRRQIIQMSRRYDFQIPNPVTARELLAGKMYKSTIHNRFLVDDSQDVMQVLVSGLTHAGMDCVLGMTTNDERWPRRIQMHADQSQEGE